MVSPRVPSAQLLRSLKALTINAPLNGARSLSTTTGCLEDSAEKTASFYKNPDPETVFIPRLERKLVRTGKPPIGSRRRRMAIALSNKTSFDQLPYQCFQEARQILIADRIEKLKQIEVERSRIQRLQQTDPNTFAGGDTYKQKRLDSMQRELERLKILTDINDPNVKRRFEDNKGDMSKPIYRFLAERKWREYRRKIQVQRLEQMKVYPDVIPHIDPLVDTTIRFGNNRVQPGEFVDSGISEKPCDLKIQSFQRGEKLVTIAVVDPDVPNLETDSFDARCHFLAANIRITPSVTSVSLGGLTAQQVLLPWVPPMAQKGSPYHRLSILVFQQKDNIPVDIGIASKKVQRDGFSARSFMSRHLLHPIGGAIFRTKWDDSMAAVMARAGFGGADVELKRRKVEPLPYKRRNPSTFR